MAFLIFRGGRLLVSLLAVLGVLVTALPGLRTDLWWVRYLAYPRLQFLAAMLLLLVPAFWLPGRRRWRWPVVAALLLSSAWTMLILLPYLAPLVSSWPSPEVADGSCPAERRLRVLAANVQMTNKQDHRLLDMVRAADPDIAWFQETNDWWEGELAPLSAAMPHGLSDAQANYYGIHLFSKLPLEAAELHRLTNSRNPSVFATARLPSGDRVKVYAVHPRPPQIGQDTTERDGQLMAAALAARGDALPHLLLGDLNTVPWERVLHQLERVGGFRDPRVGRGLFITWNTGSWLLKWPLDHILPGPGWTMQRLRVLPEFGSDHHPLLADLCLGPGARTEPPPLGPEELARAQAAVRRAQGKAVSPGSAVPPGSEATER